MTKVLPSRPVVQSKRARCLGMFQSVFSISTFFIRAKEKSVGGETRTYSPIIVGIFLADIKPATSNVLPQTHSSVRIRPIVLEETWHND